MTDAAQAIAPFTFSPEGDSKIGIAICLDEEYMLEIDRVEPFKRTDDGKTIYILHVSTP